jgi:hypothetical protein
MPSRANSTGAGSGQGVPADDLARTLWVTFELGHPRSCRSLRSQG